MVIGVKMSTIRNSAVLVTGGAGFIGSHLVDALMPSEVDIVVFDNESSGDFKNLKPWVKSKTLKCTHADLKDKNDIEKAAKNCASVFHFAANPEVRVGSVSPYVHYQQNIAATFNLLEALRKDGSIKTLVFTSSSTVYGDATEIPTPEDYTPLKPISVYGASKLACEALITAYAYTYGFEALIYRLANIVGSRSKYGVIGDFIQKLKKNPNELEILGDGTQNKSYLHVDDCVNAMLLGLKSKSQVEFYNVGSEDQISVVQIAKIVLQQLELKNTKLTFTGGVDGGRGWKGDVKNMLLDISKLKSLGWEPRHNSAEAVRKVTKQLLRF